MGHYLYRKAGPAASVALTAMFLIAYILPLAGQRSGEKPRGPRAVAVLEFVGEVPRLLPVVILDNGRLYDAGLYRATPRPMALQPHTVYEAERAGASQGLFTITEAERVDRNWFALGEWRPGAYEEAPAKPGEPTGPRARRDSGGFVFGAPPGEGTAQESEQDEGPPVIRRPGESGSDEAETQPESTGQEDDPERPTIRRPEEPSPAETPELPDPDDDPNRPILRRDAPQPKVAPKRPRPQVTEAPTESARYLVAVSDATPMPRTVVRYEFRAGEEARLREQMAALAREELTRTARPRGVTPQQVSAAKMENAALHAFDLDYDGSAELVFTADFTVAGAAKTKPLTWHAAVIARTDSEGRPRKLWSSTTAGDRLDIARRLELVDAVDVNGDGRAELLFRSHGQGGFGFEVYSLSRYAAERLFEGAWTPDQR